MVSTIKNTYCHQINKVSTIKKTKCQIKVVLFIMKTQFPQMKVSTVQMFHILMIYQEIKVRQKVRNY